MELINNAVNGWFRYTSDGKLVVLFLGVLLYLWYGRRKAAGRKEKWLFWYAAVSVLLAVVPVTAGMLMLYMTKFYDYEWIWSVVPVTIIVAFGGTVIYTGCYEKYWKDKKLLPICFCGLGLGVLLLCGGMGKQVWDKELQAQELENAVDIVDYITENGKNIDICLWAPEEIMDYVRGMDGRVTLLYGRDMWEDALKAFSYDTYRPEIKKLYEWMEGSGVDDGTQALSAEECMEIALEHGVNVVVLPVTASGDAWVGLGKAVENRNMDMETEQYGAYDIYRIY